MILMQLLKGYLFIAWIMFILSVTVSFFNLDQAKKEFSSVTSIVTMSFVISLLWIFFFLPYFIRGLTSK